MLQYLKGIPLPKLIGAKLAFLLPLVAYILTAPHTIYFGDAPEFITAAATLGIPHPSGYPLYVILGKIFTSLPLGSIPFRMVLLSAIASAAALALFYFFLIHIIEDRWEELSPRLSAAIACGGTLVLAFSNIYWQQSINAKPYALLFLSVMVLITLITKYWQSGNGKLMLWAAFVGGLGLALHTLMLLLLPVFAACFWIGATRKPTAKTALWSLAILVATTAILYGLLPLRSMMHPALDWGNTGSSFHAFMTHVLRRQYQDIGTGAHAAGGEWTDKARYFYDFALQLFYQFKWALVLVILGLIPMVKYQKRLLFLTGGILLLNTLGLVLLRQLPFSYEGAQYYSTYYLPAYAMAAVWIACGGVELFAWLIGFLPEWAKLGQKILEWAAAVLIAAIAITIFSINVRADNQRSFTYLNDYSRQLLLSLEPHAVLLTSVNGPAEDSMLFSLLYQQTVAHLRTDVSIVGYVDVFPNSDRAAINKIYELSDSPQRRAELISYALHRSDYASRPLYTTFLANVPETTMVSNGIAYKIESALSPTQLQDQTKTLGSVSVEPSANDTRIMGTDLYGSDFLAHYYYAQAALYAARGDLSQTQDYFIKAIQESYDPQGLDSETFMQYRAMTDTGVK